MKFISPKTLAAGAAQSWKSTYGNDWRGIISGSTREIYDKLLNLGSSPCPKEVAQVIGNHSWTCTTCNECKSEDVSVIELGEEPDYEFRTCRLCFSCLAKAIKLIGK